MAAGAPTTDPGASQRLMGQAFQGFGNAYQGAQQHQMQQELRAMQIEEAKRKAESAKQAQAMWQGLFSPSGGTPPTAAGAPSVGPAPSGSLPPAAGGSVPPTAPANPLQSVLAGMTPQQRATLQAVGPEKGLPLLMEQAFAKPSAPETKVIDGDIYERDPSGQWVKALDTTPAPKDPTGTMAEFEAWKKTNPNGTFTDFKRDIAAATRAPDKPSDRQNRIDMMVQNGVPPNVATSIATGQYRVTTDAFNKSPKVVDIATGRVVGELTPEQAQSVQPPAAAPNQSADPQGAPPQTPTLLSGVQETYGPGATILDFLGKSTGGVLYSAPEENTRARQKARIFRETMVDAFARSDKPSTYAQKRVEELIPSLGVLEDPVRAWDMLVQTKEELEAGLREDKAILNNRASSIEAQKDAERRIAAKGIALRMIGDPEKSPRPTSSGSPAPDAPTTPAPEGVSADQWRYMTPEERALWQN